MLSAAGYPIVLFGSVHLPFILPHDAALYAVLRKAHTMLAYLFFLTFLAHFGGDSVSHADRQGWNASRMVPWNVRPPDLVPGSGPSTSRIERVEK